MDYYRINQPRVPVGLYQHTWSAWIASLERVDGTTYSAISYPVLINQVLIEYSSIMQLLPWVHPSDSIRPITNHHISMISKQVGCSIVVSGY